MDRVFVHITQIWNQTDELFEFQVENELLQIRALAPGKSRQVKLWKILESCRKYRSAGWKINVLIRNQVSGIEIRPLHLLCCTRIVIRFERNGGRLYLLLEGILEEKIDHLLRLNLVFMRRIRNKYWGKRHCIPLARTETRLRLAEAPQPQPRPQPHDLRPARDEGLQQIRQRQVIIGSSSGRQGSPNDQSLIREYLEETENPADQISNSSTITSTNEESTNHSRIIPDQQRRGNMLVGYDPNNIIGNHVEAVRSDGITTPSVAETPAPRQETFRGRSSSVGSWDSDMRRSGGPHQQRQIMEDDLQRLYSLPMFQNMDITVRLLLFLLALMSACLIRLLF